MAPECFDHWATWASYRVPAVMIYLTKHITFWQLSHCRLSGNKVGGKWSKQVVKEIWEKDASHVVPLLSIQWSHLLCILQQRPQCFLIGQMALNPQNCPFHGGSRFFWLMHVSPPPSNRMVQPCLQVSPLQQFLTVLHDFTVANQLSVHWRLL